MANIVELERHWAKIVIECDSKNVKANLCLDRDLLSLHAYDLRNTAAASALKAYYQLAGLEAQKHYLNSGREELRKTLSRIEKVIAEGLTLPQDIEHSAVASKLSQLEDQALQLEFLRIQLNGQLQTLIGCPLDEYSFFWPQVDWKADLRPVDIELEVASGLDTRSDLQGLSLVLCKFRKHTLSVARGVLKFADSTVGTVEPQDGWIHVARCFRCNEKEVPIRCRQLALFYKHSKQGATAEIKSAAYKIGLQQQKIVVAQGDVEQLEKRLAEMSAKRDLEDVSIFELSEMRGRIYEAEADLIRQTVALYVARIELKEAQDMLALECGFSPQLCCESCCDGDCCQAACEPCSCKTSKKPCQPCCP
ncbi:MAG: hypothetical protein MK171_10530 [Pirellulales bacterium]|nr:hypothetical protein [Pirellulales bacterium]